MARQKIADAAEQAVIVDSDDVDVKDIIDEYAD